jgi:predicted DNA-binding transcriptional regulator YafY
VEDVISNLEWRFKLRGKSENIIGFEQNDQLKGLNWLSTIIDATSNHQVLKVKYRNYKNCEVEITAVVHPWYVKQYNNRWFLMAYNAEHNSITNFALDRILDLEIVEDIQFIKNENIDFDEYFKDVIGVTIPKPEITKQRIVLRFSAKQYPYVASKPMHQSQEIVNEEERTIAIEVRPNYELEQQIFSFGPDVEVLAPETYREYITEKILNNYKKYAPVQKGCTDDV